MGSVSSLLRTNNLLALRVARSGARTRCGLSMAPRLTSHGCEAAPHTGDADRPRAPVPVRDSTLRIIAANRISRGETFQPRLGTFTNVPNVPRRQWAKFEFGPFQSHHVKPTSANPTLQRRFGTSYRHFRTSWNVRRFRCGRHRSAARQGHAWPATHPSSANP